jgi:DNA-binding transcriptional ArsR family regulator
MTPSMTNITSVNEIDPTEVEECRRLASSWAPALHALAHEDRLLIALWLAGSTCSVRELERVTGLGQSLVSYHLRELRTAGLVTVTTQGRSNRYKLAHANLDQLAGLIGNLQPEPLETESAEASTYPLPARAETSG